MSEFNNVTVVREANVYFDGKVTSRTILFADGTRKTLGIMLPGEYTFSAGVGEVMEILAGNLLVQLPGNQKWREVSGGESFDVPAGETFNLKVLQLTDYCCSYLEV